MRCQLFTGDSVMIADRDSGYIVAPAMAGIHKSW